MTITAPASAVKAALAPIRSHAKQRYGTGQHAKMRLFFAGTICLAQAYDGESVLRQRVTTTPTGEGSPEKFVEVETLYKTARSLGEDDMALEFTEDGITVRSGGEFEAKIEETIRECDHPALEVEGQIQETFDAEALREVVAGTVYATDRGSHADPKLEGVYFDLKAPTVVATDGRRAAQTPLPEQKPWQGIVPRSAARRLVSVLPEEGDVEAELGPECCTFSWGEGELRTPLVQREYPRYQKGFPGEMTYTTEVEKAVFVDACRRMSLYAGGMDEAMELSASADGNLWVRAEDLQERAEAEETIQTQTPFEAPPELVMKCNPDYLREAAEALPGDVIELGIRGPSRPIRLRPVDSGVEDEAVVMPVMDSQPKAA